MPKRIRTIGGSGGQAPTVTIGPEFGTDILLQEQGFSSAFQVEANYVLDHEQLIRLFELRSGPHLMSQEQEMAGTYVGPPQLRGVATAASTSDTTALTLSISSTQPGLFHYAIMGAKNPAALNIATPVGWTSAASASQSTNVSMATFWRVAQAGDSTAVVFGGGVAVGRIGTVLSLQGVDTTTPIGVSGFTTAVATDPVAPDVTSPEPNAYIVAACAQRNAGSQSYLPPAGYAEQSDLDGAASVRCTGEVATRTQGSSGATGTATMNSDQALGSGYVAIHVALKAAQGGTTFS